MKRRFISLLTLISMLVCTLIMPGAKASAVTEKIKLYGNSIPVNTKQICFVKGKEGSSILGPDYYAPGFKKYYYVGDNVINFKTVAKQLPELQNIAVVQCDVKNLSSLEGMKDLVWLGLYQCEGADDLSFLKKLPGLTKFRYSHIYMDKGCKSIKPISYLKNLKELYLYTGYKCVEDIAPLKGLTKLKKLEISNFGGKNISVLKNMKSLKELDIEINSAEKVDISVLGELQKLEKLSVTSDGSRTRLSGLPEIIKLKKLKDLTINGFDYEDLSFMGEMQGLDSLSIWYSNGTFSKTIGELTNLKSLALNDISGTGSRDMSYISKLKSLESLRVSGSRRLSLDGASKLKKLKSVSIMLCEFTDLSQLKKCPALEDLLVYNCNSDFDVSWISGSGLKDVSISAGGSGCLKNMDKLSTLKSADRIALDFTGISENTIKKIKKSVPDCRVEVYELNYYGNYEPIVY